LGCHNLGIGPRGMSLQSKQRVTFQKPLSVPLHPVIIFVGIQSVPEKVQVWYVGDEPVRY